MLGVASVFHIDIINLGNTFTEPMTKHYLQLSNQRIWHKNFNWLVCYCLKGYIHIIFVSVHDSRYKFEQGYVILTYLISNTVILALLSHAMQMRSINHKCYHFFLENVIVCSVEKTADAATRELSIPSTQDPLLSNFSKEGGVESYRSKLSSKTEPLVICIGMSDLWQ